MKKTVVDEYIENCPKDRQEKLRTMQKIMKDVFPEAKECIKYGMPTYFQHENIVHFSNAKHHIGFYPTPAPICHFSKELEPYKTSKGAIQFPVEKELPEELIQRICEWRLEQLTK
ncbi:MAG: DUF1801 domain-containing protein [Vagococcus sp.]|uniref:iron chaperone n=1 Tax=Vagococcus sp. TaxID=1933889 RepID=UPI002FC6A837